MTGKKPQRVKIGEGYISGYLSILFALVAVGAAACLLFPSYLTTAEFRAVYPAWFFRAVMLTSMVFAFGFAFSSFVLSRKSKLALLGTVVATLAVLSAGDITQFGDVEQSIAYLSVDWLLIDIILLSVIFIPIELFFPKREDQSRFHLEWKTDVVYFVISHLLVQYTAILVKFPAEALFQNVGLETFQAFILGLPFIVQLFLAMFLADLFQYAVHRTFHRTATLWRFHEVHHSIKAMDWIAGSRLHFVDIFVTRAFSYLPLYVLGISIEVFYAYVAIVAIQSVAVHANTRIPFGWLKYVFVTPQYHHWHHSDDPKYYDKNFAIHFTLIDRMFGTYHLPDNEWPEAVGLRGVNFPKGYWKQFIHPFRGE